MNRKYAKRTAAGLMSFAMVMASASMSALPSSAESGVSINEVCPKNTTFSAPDGGLYDWVELYNSSNNDVDLSGWGLSDKSSEPYKHKIPDGTRLAPKQRLLIFCDSTAGANDAQIAPFGLSTSGETLTLTDAAGAEVSKITFEAMAADTSYGQYPDGSGEFFTLSCTPNNANIAPEGSNAVRTPEFSAESGFYDREFQLTITAPEGTKIYYTTDGTDPTAQSKPYDAPITIKDMSDTENVYSARTDISADNITAPTEKVDKAAIIRAVAVDSQGRISESVTKTYFIGKTNSSYYPNMKVISLVTDPDNLFDYEKGIYVKGKIYDDKYSTQGGGPNNPWGGGFGGIGGWGGGFGGINPWEMEANYTQHGRDWEREASMEMFDNGTKVLSQNVGIRIKGAASRSAAQKSLNIYARKDYGVAEFDYDLFDGTAVKAKNGKSIKKFEGFTVRNGGNDNGSGTFRDCINQQLVKDRDFATQATSECIVFIDGEYWGMYQITERISDDYIDSHYGIKKNDVAIVKNSELEEGSEQDLNDWNQLLSFCASADMKNDSNYSRFEEAVDVQSYIDYFAAQIYWSNADWPQNNVAAWRSNAVDEENPYSDGKWRMFMFDTEYATSLYGQNDTSLYNDIFGRIAKNKDDMSRMFTNLLKNDKFREQFTLTFMDLANYNFTNEKTSAVVQKYLSAYKQQALDTYKRFNAGNYQMYRKDNFESELKKVEEFYRGRFDAVNQQLKNALSLSGNLSNITVENDGSTGSVKINTISLDDSLTSFSGKYYTDYNVTVSASAKDGSRFSHWEVSGANLSQDELNSPTISIKLNGDVKVKAVYEAGAGLLRGDFNGDGVVNTADLVALEQFITGRLNNLADTDMVMDGNINSFDAAALRKFLLSK